MKEKPVQCAFCYPREQGKNGEVKREWASDWNQFVAVCRKHTFGGVEGLVAVKELSK